MKFLREQQGQPAKGVEFWFEFLFLQEIVNFLIDVFEHGGEFLHPLKNAELGIIVDFHEVISDVSHQIGEAIECISFGMF